MLTILWSQGIGVALTLAGVCALIWLVGRPDERRSLATLMLCVLGVATAMSAHIELAMMHAKTPAEYGEWLRWYHVPTYVSCVAMVFFVRGYVGTGRLWLMWVIIFARSLLLVVNFSVDPNVNFSNIASLHQFPLLGEQVSVIGVATTRGWQWFALASMILLTAYLIDAAAQAWRDGGAESKRKALAIMLGLVVPQVCTYAYVQFVAFGLIEFPLSNAPWFLGALFIMATELGRELFLNARANLELAELRNEVAQVGRVNVLGQFASALAHELAQPLNGITLNVAAARRRADEPQPDIKELRTILDDIDDDGLRGAKLIHRMRQLFERRKVETQPVSVEEVMQDVVALVRAEAKSKQVDVALRVQPWLPAVHADRVHLCQVLLNLVANAIHAVQSRPAGARSIALEARADMATHQVEIVVRDSGPGIPADLVEKVFEPFYSTKPDGMGIGLALSRTIIEAQGGRLWADHEANQQGAVFRLTLNEV